MKIFKQLAIVVVAVIIFGACQKELSFNEDGISVGTLQKSNATGDCLPATVYGIFKKDSVLTNLNYVDVQINVTIAGTFEIKSDTVNGYSFQKSGNAGTGINTIRLYASGKPLTAGTNMFTIRYGTSVCTFDVTVVAATGGTAIFSLGGSPNSCALFTPSGTYVAGTLLTTNNKVTFTVNVTNPGTYSISTPAVNGMTFSASGTFVNGGVQNVTMMGSGTPLAPGNFTFTPTNGSSTCNFIISVGGGTAASYTLNGSPGSCSGAILHGSYTSGTALTSANKVDIFVNVTVPGSYSISTNTVNGMTFSKTGTFTSTGTAEMVTLAGTGTPVNGSVTPFNFTATAGASSCIFSVTVNTGTVSGNTDYIPETVNSNWSDLLIGGTPSDTTYNLVSPNTIIRSGNTYRVFHKSDDTGVFDSSYHRKNAGKYYEYLYGDYGIFDNPINQELLLIDSTLAVNGTWTTTFPGNSIGGIPATLKINAQIIAKGATATVQGIGYGNIIKVKFTFQINFMGTGFTDVATEEFWYAKGKGLINDIQQDVPPTTTTEYQTTRTQIY